MRATIALAFGLLLTAVAPPSHADLVVRSNDGATELRLYESKCSHGGTLALIREEHRAEFRNAQVLTRTGTIEAFGCYIEMNGVVLVVFEDATMVEVKLSAFKDPVV